MVEIGDATIAMSIGEFGEARLDTVERLLRLHWPSVAEWSLPREVPVIGRVVRTRTREDGSVVADVFIDPSAADFGDEAAVAWAGRLGERLAREREQRVIDALMGAVSETE